MHRFIESDDVIDYSTGAKKRDIELRKDEDIEYRDGVLYHSSGDASLKLKHKSNMEDVQEGNQTTLSDAFSAHGSYTLNLQQCYVKSKKDKIRQRRSLMRQMSEDTKEEGLKINFNMSKYQHIDVL